MLRILNTRPLGQNQDLSRLLRESDFDPIEIPLVEIAPLPAGLEKIQKLNPANYGGIFLSSPNGFRMLQENSSAWMKLPFYTVGIKTKTWIEKLGGTVAFCPQGSSLDRFLLEFKSEFFKNSSRFNFEKPWLHACSSSTRVDEKIFKEMGIQIENIPVYYPRLPETAKENLKFLFENKIQLGNTGSVQKNNPAAILFCSGSGVDNFFSANPFAMNIVEDKANALQNLAVISIGQSTTRALKAKGITTVQEAAVADDFGMVQALKAALHIPPSH